MSKPTYLCPRSAQQSPVTLRIGTPQIQNRTLQRCPNRNGPGSNRPDNNYKSHACPNDYFPRSLLASCYRPTRAQQNLASCLSSDLATTSSIPFPLSRSTLCPLLLTRALSSPHNGNDDDGDEDGHGGNDNVNGVVTVTVTQWRRGRGRRWRR